jgi:FKBP-type peptidyl-prolyl cis-trans isomerase SlyD
MKIDQNKYVSLIYELKAGETQEIVEPLDPERPLNFVFGTGFLLPEFESNIEGKGLGEKFSFSIKSDDAYGPVDLQAIVDLPKTIFLGDGKMTEEDLFIGKMIPMMTQSGNRMNGKIVELFTDSVKMDFNHPMAGKDLYFKGEILEVREATQQEIDNIYNPAASCSTCGSGDGCDGTC